MKSLIPTCLVEVDTGSCSGIIINSQKGYVVTHATILLPYLANHFSTFKRLLKDGSLRSDAFGSPNKVQVTVEQRLNEPIWESGRNNRSDFKTSRGFTVEPINLVASSSKLMSCPSQLIKQNGRVKFVWRSDQFANTLKRLFPASEWKFLEDPPRNKKAEAEPEISKEQVYHLLPYFVLIEVSSLKDLVSPVNQIVHNKFIDVTVGTNVLVVATPFGNLSPEVFLNSVSNGIISNLVGERQELILTDARCIPGSEGGAIYDRIHLNENPVGMVVAPLCWKANEWVGLAIGCKTKEILSSLKKSIKDPVSGLKAETNGSTVSSISRNPFQSIPIVLVSSGATWGSGVLIDQTQGLIVTCSHVVDGAKDVRVRIDVPRIAWFTAELVYATADDQVFDIAVLRLKDFQARSHWPKTIDTEDNIAEGSEVYVIGHAAFGQEDRMNPSVTHGVISKVLFSHQTPVILQTSCSVNSGASGGAVVSKSGRLLGLVVCNARDKDCGATYPHLNLSIPVVTVWPAISLYVKSEKISDLEPLTLKDPRVKRLWMLKGSDAASVDAVKSHL